MAAELGLDVATCKRAAFLHDIGKALTHEVEGPHAIIGAELLRRHGEHEDIVHAVEAHHNEVEPRTVEAVLTQAADADLGFSPGCPPRVARGLRRAHGEAERMATAHEEPARLRHAGRPRGARHGLARGHRRRRGPGSRARSPGRSRRSSATPGRSASRWCGSPAPPRPRTDQLAQLARIPHGAGRGARRERDEPRAGGPSLKASGPQVIGSTAIASRVGLRC